MKFIHCSDLHLDSKIEGLPTEKSRIRREEILRTFERLAKHAKENDVCAVIIAGDMFDTARVSVKTKERVISVISECANVDFIYLSGNHDESNFINTIEQLPANLKCVGEDWEYFNYGDVTIASIMLTNANSKAVYDTLKLDENSVNVVALHGQVVGYKGDGQAHDISIPKLKEKNIDYLALGHIHSYSEGQIDLRGNYVYSGCLDGRGFDELGDKGFVLIDVQKGKINKEFIKFSSRTLHEYEFNVENYPSWHSAVMAIESQLKNEYDKNSLIKVVLSGEHKTDFYIDTESLAMRLNEFFFFAKVYDKTKLKIEQSDYETDKSVRGEFVRAVLGGDMDEEQKKQVLLLGLNALKGEEI